MLGNLADGTPVYDRSDSHLVAHEEARPWLHQAFSQVRLADFRAGAWAGICDLGQVLGLSTCLSVRPEDEVVYALRYGRLGYTRFVRGRQGQPCTTLKLVMRWSAEQACVILRTAFVGGDTPPEPWSSGARESFDALQRSQAFWAHHALVWDEASIDFSHPVLVEAPPGYWGH